MPSNVHPIEEGNKDGVNMDIFFSTTYNDLPLINFKLEFDLCAKHYPSENYKDCNKEELEDKILIYPTNQTQSLDWTKHKFYSKFGIDNILKE